MNDCNLKSIFQRIEKMEKTLSILLESQTLGSSVEKKSKEKFTGPTGGIRFLVTKGFFVAKRGLADVKNELEKNGYHYSIQAVQVGLSRLSRPGGPLVSVREDKRKNMPKENKKMRIATTATGSLKILWEKSFFRVAKKQLDIVKYLAGQGYNFTEPELGMALLRAKYLMRRGKKGNYEYTQKHPYVTNEEK